MTAAMVVFSRLALKGSAPPAYSPCEQDIDYPAVPKASSDRATLDRLLDTVHIGHFAIVDDDAHPVVLPTAVVRDGDRVLAHGSTGSRWLRRLAAGAPACLAVTAFDALVVARSAFESSMRYRSAALFGQCQAITEQVAKRRALDTITDALIPGRSAEVRP